MSNSKAVAVCPMCQERGVHPSVDDCLVALRGARAAYERVNANSCRIVIKKSGATFRRVQRWLVFARVRGLRW